MNRKLQGFRIGFIHGIVGISYYAEELKDE